MAGVGHGSLSVLKYSSKRWRVYDPHLTLTLTGAYRTGKQTGDWVYFKADGTTPERTVTYRNGQVYDPRARPKPVSKPRPALPKRK